MVRTRSFGLKPRKSQRNFWSLSTKNNEFFFLIHTYPDTLPISDLPWTWENYKSHQNLQRFLWLYNTKTGNLTRIASLQKSLSARAVLQNMRGQRVTVQCYPRILTDDRRYNEVQRISSIKTSSYITNLTLRFSGNKINCFPGDQSLSVNSCLL